MAREQNRKAGAGTRAWAYGAYDSVARAGDGEVEV
jgi:hypothetical protein